MKSMTIEEAKALPREWLKTSEVASLLGMKAYAPVLIARKGGFPFHVLFSGNRPKFPKRAVIAYLEGREVKYNG